MQIIHHHLYINIITVSLYHHHNIIITTNFSESHMMASQRHFNTSNEGLRNKWTLVTDKWQIIVCIEDKIISYRMQRRNVQLTIITRTQQNKHSLRPHILITRPGY